MDYLDDPTVDIMKLATEQEKNLRDLKEKRNQSKKRTKELSKQLKIEESKINDLERANDEAEKQNSELEARLEYTMQMKQDELNALRKLEAESTQLENEAAELTSNTVAAKRGFIEKMQSALAEKRTMLNLPSTTDLGDNSIDPDATKMKALSKELATAFQKVPLNGRLALYGTFLTEANKFAT